jgi:two-component system, LytTR family, response regulator
MITAVIIDDDPKCREAIKQHFTVIGKRLQLLGEAGNADEGKALIAAVQPQLVFLDVEMPGKTGFEMLDEIEHLDFDVIFTTAYEKYAIQAIRSSALDFLPKPVLEEDLLAALQRVEAKKNRAQTLRQVEILLQNIGSTNGRAKRIAVPTMTGLDFISTDKIIRLEAEGSYTTFFLSDKIKLVVAKTLKEMEELLPEKNFFRVHHSHLVNLDYIKKYQKSEGGLLIMEDGSDVSVSRHRKDEFLERFRNHG